MNSWTFLEAMLWIKFSLEPSCRLLSIFAFKSLLLVHCKLELEAVLIPC